MQATANQGQSGSQALQYEREPAVPSAQREILRLTYTKCDNTHPVCTQCVKARRVCDGVPAENAGLPFRNENDYASGVYTRKPRKARSKSNKDKLARKAVTTTAIKKRSRSSVSLLRNSPYDSDAMRGFESIPRRLETSLEDQALTRFVNCHIDETEPLNDCIWNYFSNCPFRSEFQEPCSILGLALNAVALAKFSRARMLPLALVASRRSYNEAISKTRLVLENVDQATTDQMLAAAMLFSSYEVRDVAPLRFTHIYLQMWPWSCFSDAVQNEAYLSCRGTDPFSTAHCWQSRRSQRL